MGGEVGHRHLIQADSKAGRRECGASAEVGVSEELSPDAATTGTPNAASRPMRRSRSLDAVLGMKLPIANSALTFAKQCPGKQRASRQGGCCIPVCIRAANKTLLAWLPRLVVLLVQPSTQHLARTASLSLLAALSPIGDVGATIHDGTSLWAVYDSGQVTVGYGRRAYVKTPGPPQLA